MEKKIIQYNPEILGSLTSEITSKADFIGLTLEGINNLNVARYINKLQILQVDGLQLSIIPEQTKEMVLTAVYQNPLAIQFAVEQDIHSITIALNQDPSLIKYIVDQTDEIIYMALDLDPNSLLHVKNYTREHAKYAIEKKLDLIFCINRQYIDEDMIMFYLDSFRNDIASGTEIKYYNRYNHLYNPLKLFSNSKLKKHALEIYPYLLTMFNPDELSREELLVVVGFDDYKYKMSDYKFLVDKEFVEELIKNNSEIFRGYGIFNIIDIDCIYPEFLKVIVENISKYQTIRYVSLLTVITRQEIMDMINDNIDYIFNEDCIISFQDVSNGFSNKSVIKSALRRDKKQSRFLNFWKNKVSHKYQ